MSGPDLFDGAVAVTTTSSSALLTLQLLEHCSLSFGREAVEHSDLVWRAGCEGTEAEQGYDCEQNLSPERLGACHNRRVLSVDD
jgi:hypothetical protein